MAQNTAPAGALRRLLAMLYDGVLLIAVLMVGSFAFLPLTGGEAADGPMRFVFQTYLVLLITAFFAFFWMRGGQTLGMRAWDLTLIRPDGGPLTLPDVLVRLLAATVTLGPVSLISVPFHGRRHSLTDMLSGTVVIRQRTRDVV